VVDISERLRLSWRAAPTILRPISPAALARLPARVADLAARAARRIARDRGRVPRIAKPDRFAARVRTFARSLEILFSDGISRR